MTEDRTTARDRVPRIALASLLLSLLPAPAAAQVADREPEPARVHEFALTLREIMRGPELVGEAPTDLRWTDDGRWLYFRWRPGGGDWQDERELWRVAAEGGAPEKVPEAERDSVEILIARGDVSPDGSRRVVDARGDLFVVDRRARAWRRLTDTRARESDPRFTPDGRAVLYREDDDLFELRLGDGRVRQVTDIRSGAPPGEPDEPEGREEFLRDQQLELFEHVRREAAREDTAEARRERRAEGDPDPLYVPSDQRVTTLDPAPDGRYVLVGTRASEAASRGTEVPEWITATGYTATEEARSKVGDARGATRLGLLRTGSGEASWLDPRPEGYEGEVRASSRGWNDAGTHALVVSASDDDEDRFLYALEAATGELTLLARLHDDAWIGGPCGGCMGWLPGTATVYYASEESGFSHLYAVEADGTGRRALTSGDWEVRDARIPEVDGRRDAFLLTTGEGSPFDRRLAWMDLDGGERRYLTDGRGGWEGTPSPTGRRMAVVHSVANRPPELYLGDGERLDAMQRITTSPTDAWSSFPWIEPEIVRFRAADGASVPARIYRPADLGAEPSGAGVIFVHGAGYLHNVHNWWSSYYREYMFHHFLAASGYTVLDIDYRGSAGYGRDWRTAIYRHMGGRDLDDQVDGARWLVEHEGVDADRIGIYGGSYGGFITLMALFTAGDTFRAGAALRSVTDWAHYNDGYTSNILNDPQEDAEAYRRSSPIYFAESFGPDQHLLIAHGMVDTNVHFSDVVRLVQRLIELGKENWELAVYPAEGHAFEAPAAWTDEYRRIFELFDRTLKDDERRP